MMKNRIIAFAGRKRSGKTELSKFLKEEYDAVIITIASYLKELCAELLSCDINELLLMKDDGTVFEYNLNEKWLNILHNKTNIAKDVIEKEMGNITFTNVRQMLQVIGTDLIRKYNPNWHVEQMVNEIKSYDGTRLITIDDVRFPNEKEAIEQLGGEVFFIIRTSNCLNVSNHISERSLTWKAFDDKHIIVNNDTVEKLQKKLQKWCNEVLTLMEQDITEIPNTAREFGYIWNKEVENIVEKIKDDETFDTKGIVDLGDGVLINNPFITENLKRWL